MRALLAMTCLLLVAPLGCGVDADDGDGNGSGSGSGTGSGRDPNLPPACPDEAEVCGYRDGGWEARCDAGVVTMYSFNTMLYCAPPDSEILCESEPPPPSVVHTCTGACAADDRQYLETIDEYHAFAAASLCE